MTLIFKVDIYKMSKWTSISSYWPRVQTLLFGHTNTHTWQPDCSTWTTNVVGN